VNAKLRYAPPVKTLLEDQANHGKLNGIPTGQTFYHHMPQHLLPSFWWGALSQGALALPLRCLAPVNRHLTNAAMPCCAAHCAGHVPCLAAENATNGTLHLACVAALLADAA